MKKQPKYPIHRMGTHYGYDELANGDIKVAPACHDRMDAALQNHRAVESLIQVTLNHCHTLRLQSQNSMDSFWTGIKAEYPDVFGDNDLLEYLGNGIVRKTEGDKETK